MTTYWIDPTSGDDADDGTTKLLAVKTFTVAFGLLSDGDTLTVVDGTHVLTASEWATCSVESTLTSENSDPRTCIIDGDSKAYYLRLDFDADINASGVQFIDMALPAIRTGILSVATVPGVTMTCNNLWFRNIDILLQNGGCIFVNESGASVIVVSNCVFQEIARQSGSGCICARSSADSFTIVNCVFSSLSDTLFYAFTYASAASPTLSIKNCIFNADTSSNQKIVRDAASGVLTFTEFSYNDYYNAGSGVWEFDDAPDTEVGNIEVDPLMVDPAALNFNLAPDSPCIDAGNL